MPAVNNHPSIHLKRLLSHTFDQVESKEN